MYCMIPTAVGVMISCYKFSYEHTAVYSNSVF